VTGGTVQQPWPPAVAGWYPGHLMHEEAKALSDRMNAEAARVREDLVAHQAKARAHQEEKP
jgi:hypothetical protein